MAKKNYYDVLGVSKTADEKEIKRAYRKLAMKYHPDKLKDGTSDEKMQELNEAYEVLSDKSKRENYDRFGDESGPQFNPGAGAGGMGNFKNFAENIFSNIFGNFGGSSRRASSTAKIKGDDIVTEIVIDFNEAVLGKKFKEQLTKYEICSKCNGTGSNNPSDVKTCSFCKGKGAVRRTQQTPFGVVETRSTCPKCHGKGKTIAVPCRECGGSLYTKKTKNVTFGIPEGTDNGEKIKLPGYGEKGENGGPSGDLYIIVRVKPHKYFVRKNLDVYLDLPVSFLDIVKENMIKIPTPYGYERIKMKSTYQSGKILNVSGKGIRSKKGTGNLKIKIQVIMPPFTSDQYSQMSRVLENFDDTVNEDFMREFRK